MKTAFDLDGVIIRDSLGLTRNYHIGNFFNYYFFSTSVGRLYYRFRRPDKKIRAWIENRKERGEEVLIISGTNQDHEFLVKRWLERHKIPYDHLCLKRREEGIARFKTRILQERNCQFYLEDDPRMAQKVITFLGKEARIRKWRNFFLIKLKSGQK